MWRCIGYVILQLASWVIAAIFSVSIAMWIAESGNYLYRVWECGCRPW